MINYSKNFLFSTIAILLFFLFLNPCHVDAQTQTNEGTDFWVAFPKGTNSTSLKLFISSSASASGNIYSDFPGINQPFTVVPGLLTEISLPTSAQLLGSTESKGIRITSTVPVAVYGLNYATGSTDAFTAFPVTSLGTSYRLLGYKVGLQNNGSGLSVVAVTNGTNVTIHNKQTGETKNITLNTGKTFYESLSSYEDDITGSTVESNFPVAVFGSAELGQVPVGCLYADHMVEQMMPVTSWGKNFITAMLAGRDASGDIFRILANEDGTNVSVNDVPATTLNAGDYYETNLTGNNSITATKPVLVAQYAKGIKCSGDITGDPFMMLIPPREQFLTQYTIGTITGFTTYFTNIVAQDIAINSIYEDGILIPSSAFQPVGATGYNVAQRSITAGTHVYSGSFPFGVFNYGWTSVNSYGYPGGCSLSPVATVSSVTLSPVTSAGTLNITNICLTAHVENSNSQPVSDILVEFNFTGLSVFKANAYTNEQGDAVYCYTQTGTIPGTHTVTAEVSSLVSNTATVTWADIPCENPNDGGTIGLDQTVCRGLDADPLVNMVFPSGQSGTLEYKWQVSTTGPTSGFIDIEGETAEEYDPGSIFQTCWFRRLSKVTCSSGWENAAISNSLQISVPVVQPVLIRHE